MTRKSVNLEQRVLQAVHHHFRLYGCSPSYIDIALATGVQARHVGRPLDGLTRRGLLSRRAGEARSIVLTERMANFSDAEIERAVLARGGRVAWSRLPELAETYQAPVAMCGMEADREIHHLLSLLDGDGDGRAAAEEAEVEQGGQDRAHGLSRREGHAVDEDQEGRPHGA